MSACRGGHRPLTPLAAPARPQAGGGVKISGLPANLAEFNATYPPTGGRVAGYPSFSAGQASPARLLRLRPARHLYRHPEDDEWRLRNKPFDPATGACAAHIPAARGPVPTGARAWRVYDGKGGWVDAEVTAREVA